MNADRTKIDHEDPGRCLGCGKKMKVLSSEQAPGYCMHCSLLALDAINREHAAKGLPPLRLGENEN